MIVKSPAPHDFHDAYVELQMGSTEDDYEEAIASSRNMDWLKIGLAAGSLVLGFYTTYLATKRGHMKAIEETR